MRLAYELEFSHDRFAVRVKRKGEEQLIIEAPYQLSDAVEADGKLTFHMSAGQDKKITAEVVRREASASFSLESESDVEIALSFRTQKEVYGAGFLVPQHFPLKGELKVDSFPAGNVQLPYAFTSSGVGLLFMDYPQLSVSFKKDGEQSALLTKKVGRKLRFELFLGKSVKDLYGMFIEEVGRPASAPSSFLFSHPIYSTWAEYKKAVDQDKVLSYARGVLDRGFPVGTLEIDDKWEVHYGDFTFDAQKFPDPSTMVRRIHEMGFSVTLWVYPFINVESENYELAARQGWLVSDGGSPLKVRWWNGEAGLIDVTNPRAREWFRTKLLVLQRDYGFDGFKFDAGDAGFFKEGATSFAGVRPSEFTDAYMGFIAESFGQTAETRVSTFSQRLGLLTRLGDKDSRWGLDNGLASVITSTLTYSMLGYPFVMPDMIGGNEYRDERCDHELFTRWVEASAPMPAIQFSIIPWRYDEKTTALAREYAWFHVTISKLTLKLVNEETLKDGSPLIRPLFFDHEGYFDLADEFTLGDRLLFAPVVERGAKSRGVKLPDGKWIDLWTGDEVVGPAAVECDAPIYKLPAYARKGAIDEPLLKEIREGIERIRALGEGA
ncbi:MAG: glycoside hydrolase family 31 protein [TACK group archaeon]|nr:glycoside hydrolase family 31 protein [TACK group archaeon]